MFKKYSHRLHAPLRGIFGSNSVRVAHYVSFIETKSTTHCDAQCQKAFFKHARMACRLAEIVVGYTESLCNRYHTNKIMFLPEFLREGNVLFNNLYPSRITVGADLKNELVLLNAKKFAQLMADGALWHDIPVLIMNSAEAEVVKLFSNTYLALRVVFFNELDTYADVRGMDTMQLIGGGLAPRIGTHYNMAMEDIVSIKIQNNYWLMTARFLIILSAP